MQLSEWLEKQRKWWFTTFGPGRRTLGLVAHIQIELAEIEAAPTDPLEWVDVFILAMEGACRIGRPLEFVIRTFDRINSVSDIDIHDTLLRIENYKHEALVADWCIVARLAVEELWQMNYNKEEILAMLEAKQIINFARQWPSWSCQDTVTEHIRGEE